MTRTCNSKLTTRRRAFTIVELLVTMAIIVILVSSALYALRVARRGANRTESANALRQIMTAYNNYSGEHSGRLMPGYLDAATLTQLQITAKSKSRQLYDQCGANGCDSSSYVWRLAPYLDHEWKTYMTDYRSGEIQSRFAEEYSCGDYTCPPYVVDGVNYSPPNGAVGPGSMSGTQLGIGLRPSFGLNSIYVGGDTTHGDTTLNPWATPAPPRRIAALRMSEVKSPAKLIVFAPTRGVGTVTISGTSEIMGYVNLCPPYADFDRDTQTASNLQWRFVANSTAPDELEYSGTAAAAGVPVDRFGDGKVSLGLLDGSVTAEVLQGLGPNNTNPKTRMTRWSPFAVGE